MLHFPLLIRQLSDNELTTGSEAFKNIEEYVCRMYSLKIKNDVNQGRFEVFEKNYKHKSDNENILRKRIIGYDASNLQPSKRELLQQVKRTVYVANVWCNAHLRYPTDNKPENFGWINIDDQFQYYWFDGLESPSFQDISTPF
jgi:hypothetical protein